METNKKQKMETIDDDRAEFEELLTLLQNNRYPTGGRKVLMCGVACVGQEVTDETFIYDMKTNSFHRGPSMKRGRGNCASVTLHDGRVFVCGGRPLLHKWGPIYSSCEIFDPVKNEFTEVGHMTMGRHFHAAVLLQDGRVFIAGGFGNNLWKLNTCEIYDPKTNKSTLCKDSLKYERNSINANLLPDGKVLICGRPSICIEIYDPETDSFAVSPKKMDFVLGDRSILLSDGRILFNTIWGCTNLSKIYDPTIGKFIDGPGFLMRETFHSMSLLADDTVFMISRDRMSGSIIFGIYDYKTGAYSFFADVPEFLSYDETFFKHFTSSSFDFPPISECKSLMCFGTKK